MKKLKFLSYNNNNVLCTGSATKNRRRSWKQTEKNLHVYRKPQFLPVWAIIIVWSQLLIEDVAQLKGINRNKTLQFCQLKKNNKTLWNTYRGHNWSLQKPPYSRLGGQKPICSLPTIIPGDHCKNLKAWKKR